MIGQLFLGLCVKTNSGALSLSKHDAEDLLDFTATLLARLYSEPTRIQKARERQLARRVQQKQLSAILALLSIWFWSILSSHQNLHHTYTARRKQKAQPDRLG
jgi:hypothetical protein